MLVKVLQKTYFSNHKPLH